MYDRLAGQLQAVAESGYFAGLGMARVAQYFRDLQEALPGLRRAIEERP